MPVEQTLTKIHDLIVRLESSNAKHDAQITALHEDVRNLANTVKDIVESTDTAIKSVFQAISAKDQNNRTRVVMSTAIIVTIVLAAGSGMLLMSNRLRDSIIAINETRVTSAYQLGRIDATLENHDKSVRELRAHILYDSMEK